MSDSLWPHGLQHTRLPCPSPTPRACSNSCPLLSQWCHPTISSSVVPFLPPSIFPSIRVFSNESVLHIRWPKINVDSILKSKDITLLTKVHIVKGMVFPVVMYGCKGWIIKKAEYQELMLLNCGTGKTPESPLDSKEIKPVTPKGNQPWIFMEGLMLKLKFQSFGRCKELTQ